VRAVRQRLLVVAVVTGLAGLGSFALGIWLTLNQTYAAFGSGSSDLSNDTVDAVPTYQGPSTWSLVSQTLLTVVGVALVAVAVVAVAGAVASFVVDGARSTGPQVPAEASPPDWPHEVVDNG
jgi:cytochrome c biogenesis protein CcdA